MSSFSIQIKEISYGNCDLDLRINDTAISCSPSYLGPNPLNTLIEACHNLYLNYYDDNEDEFCFSWLFEPGQMRFNLLLTNDKMLHIDIVDYKDEFGKSKVELQRWHEVIPFDDFKNAVVYEAFRVLKQYGLYGYRCSWSDETEFPLSILLYIVKRTKSVIKDNCYISVLEEEVNSLSEIMNTCPTQTNE